MVDHDITGVFNDRKKARKALVHLLSMGISRTDIRLARPEDDMVTLKQFQLQSKISIVAITAAGVGGVVGSLSTTLTTISPVVAAVLGTCLGVLVGGVIGSLIGAELTESEEHTLSNKKCYYVHVKSHGNNERMIEKLLKGQGAQEVKNAA